MALFEMEEISSTLGTDFVVHHNLISSGVAARKQSRFPFFVILICDESLSLKFFQ